MSRVKGGLELDEKNVLAPKKMVAVVLSLLGLEVGLFRVDDDVGNVSGTNV